MGTAWDLLRTLEDSIGQIGSVVVRWGQHDIFMGLWRIVEASYIPRWENGESMTSLGDSGGQ